MDPRLGTIDRQLVCETCSGRMAECPGHFGHLELAKPMFHIGFLKAVLSILRCVCYNCSHILAHENDHKFKQARRAKNPKQRLRRVLECCKNKTKCEGGSAEGDGELEQKGHGGCGARQPKISIDGMKIIAEFKVSKKKGDEQDQYLPEPVERKQQLTAERMYFLEGRSPLYAGPPSGGVRTWGIFEKTVHYADLRAGV